MRKLMAVAALLTALPMMGHAISASQVLVNSAGLTFSSSPVANLLSFGAQGGDARNLSVQVTYSSSTFASKTFTNGQASTGTITVVSTQPLVAVAATDSITVPSTSSILGSPATGQITVISTTGLAGLNASFTTSLSNYTGIAASSPSIILNAQLFYTYGGNWASTDTIQHAATTLATAINAGGTYSAAVTNSTGVVITLISSGTFANGWAVNSSSLTDISTGVFSGGANPVVVTLNNGVQNLVYTYGGNWASSDTVSDVAATLALAISKEPSDLILANAPAAVVYASASVVGTAANAFTMATSSASRVSVSAAVFSGGLAPALLDGFVTYNGTVYRNGINWTDSSGTSTGTAASIVTALNSSQQIVCTSSSSAIVSCTQVAASSAGNSATLTASTNLTVLTPTFTGGQDNASINIGGVILSYPTNWTLGASSTTTTTALSIAAAINANIVLNKVLIATNTLNVVNATGTVVGLSTNYTLNSSTPAALSTVGFTGGLNSAYQLNSAVIALPAHGFTTALPVLYTGTPAIGGLTTTTTYYVVVVDSNDVELSSTSAVAVVGNGIVITSSSSQATTNTYTLAPLAFSQGPAAAFWQVSNDGVSWGTYATTTENVAVSSNTFTPVNPSTTTVQDFGPIDYNYIRYNITGPTQGGVALKVILTSKD